MKPVSAVADAFLAHHLRFNPVDATFMGLPGHDADLPPADPEAAAREAEGLDAIEAALASAVPATVGQITDARLLRVILGHLRLNARDRPRFRDPTWYTGEAVFGLISLMLPGAVAPTPEALDARLAAIPRFLGEGRAQLAGHGAFAGWAARARTEIAATRRLLDGRIGRHPLWRDGMAARIPAARVRELFASA